MYSILKSLGFVGIDAFIVQVEVDISRGMPSFDIVGLPDASVKESRDRIRASLKNNGYHNPTAKITVNLAPANIKKIGSIYDLPILMGILFASEQLHNSLEDSAFIGEISLSGDVKPVTGILPMVIKAKNSGIKNIYIPYNNAIEGAIVKDINIFPIKNIKQIISHLNGDKNLSPIPNHKFSPKLTNYDFDFKDVKGQYKAKRALEIAAAGGHNILLIGPPGSGKSMLAKRMPSILPPLSFEEAIQTTKIYSIAGILNDKSPLIINRPFRAPHHTISTAGLSGGGSNPLPGEISLAHNGILFLDELPEFSRATLEILRQPIEDDFITISRTKSKISYPCSIMLVAAMNPCPCGFFGHPTRKCICSPNTVNKYINKISGPLLDRIDIHIEVSPVEFDELNSYSKSESSESIRSRVINARNIQRQRYNQSGITSNAKLSSNILQEFCKTTPHAQKILKNAFDKMGLSARTYGKILKVSRTIADLENSDIIDVNHVAEALQYRNLDKKYWQTV